MTALTQQDERQPGGWSRRKPGSARKGGLVASRAFAPLLGIWGALLGALPVLVLPPEVIAAATRNTVMPLLGVPVQPLLASMAALALGAIAFALAALAHQRARRHSGLHVVGRYAMRQNPPTIDPVRDLGSRSLDDPIAAMPFAAKGERAPATQAPQDDPADITEPGAAPVPRTLDLAEFGALPGRNAVWVDEGDASMAAPAPVAAAEPEPAPEPELAPQPAPVSGLRSVPSVPDPGTAALARLRAVEPSELSLPQMVERFAGALHEHRASPPLRALSAADLAAREAALADALKALSTLSGHQGSDHAPDHAREPLRTALAQLQRAGAGARSAG